MSGLRIAAYVQPRRTVGQVSGVGKHIGHLPVALAMGNQVQLVAARDQLEHGRLPDGSPLARLPLVALPWRARTIEWCGALAGRPRLDRYVANADWLYCPAETAPAAKSARLALTAHTSDWLEPDLPWAGEWRYVRQRLRWRLFFQAVRRRGAIVLAVSEFLKLRLIASVGLDPDRVFVVGNGVENEYFSAQADHLPPTLTCQNPYVLVVGGLGIYKGGDRVLAVARELRGRSQMRIAIVGQGDHQMECEGDEIGNVIRLGFVARENGLPALMAGASSLLLLSRYETFGIPAAEAMAAGTPVVAGATSALPEVIGDAGLLVNPDQPADIAERIMHLERSPAERAELARRGRIRAEEFSLVARCRPGSNCIVALREKVTQPGLSYMVAMLGARMHYAVPRILHRAGRLSGLYTDLCASKGPLKLLRYWPTRLRPGGLQRLLNRSPKDVPPQLIRAFTRLGLSYARDFARTSSEAERIRLFLRVNERFCRWVVDQNWVQTGGVFAYNTAALEILREARRRGLRTVMEQTIAPFAHERQILPEEHERYPLWERDLGHISEFDQYADRERQEWAESDLILCGSEFVRDGVVKCGGAAARCAVVPYGVDARFDVPHRMPHDGPLRVLTVGTVGLRKGTPYAIAAAAKMRGRAVFRWIGAFKMAPEARTELGGDIEFSGMVPRSEVIEHYAWADVFLLPSLCEGSATSTYEALTAGLPVVCTPNCGSVVRDGMEGYIVPIRDFEAICQRLETLAADAAARQKMAQHARERAAQFDYEAYARGLLAALDRSAEDDR